MSEPKSMQTPDPLYPLMHAMLQAATDLLIAAARAYREDLPDDAKAWGIMLAAGRVCPALRVELPPEGAKIQLGYLESDGKFHKFFEVPDPRIAPDASKLN